MENKVETISQNLEQTSKKNKNIKGNRPSESSQEFNDHLARTSKKGEKIKIKENKLWKIQKEKIPGSWREICTLKFKKLLISRWINKKKKKDPHWDI